MKYISYADLSEKDACEPQAELFLTTFGTEPVEVTKEWCEKYALTFDFNLAAENFLTVETRKAYEKANAPHLKAYEKAAATHWEVYKKAVATHQEAHEKAIATHWEVYTRAKAVTFYELFSQQGE